MEKQIVPELKVLEGEELGLVAGGSGGGGTPPPWPPTERTKTNTSEQV